jgi:uncharacterized protein YoxC
MTVSFARAGAWVLMQAAQAPDTVLMRQVGQDPGWFEKLTAVASGLMTIALLVLAVALVPAAWNFRKSYKRINKLLDQVYGDIHPIMRHASVIADNVNYISTSLRVDVQQVNQTIASANQRLREAVATTERRLQEFNALLAVVQHEAEDMFVSTASTVRGVRAGASAFREPDGETEPVLPEGAGRPLDDDDLYGGLEAELEAEETTDGNDGTDDDTRGREGAGPRIRPRRRPR